MATDECTATHSVDCGDGYVYCYLPEDHEGPHWDRIDDLTWQIGKPDD